MKTVQRALVLGAGGKAAIAWEIGVIAGMADAGLDVRDADLFIGTSAGSVVAAQITSGLAIEELFQRQVDPRLQVDEPAPAVDFTQWRAEVVRAKNAARNATEFLSGIGSLPPAPGMGQDDRREVTASRLPVHVWPQRRVFIVAVDADGGDRHVFDLTSDVPLVDAVAASCTVAGISPAISIKGRRYIDGGFYSIENADLAVGAERVVVLTLPARVPPLCIASLDSAVTTLRTHGARVEVVHPDDSSQAAFASVGGNLLDPAVREPAARAGRGQGQAIARHLAGFWR